MLPSDFRRIEAYFVAHGQPLGTARFAFIKYIESVENGLTASTERLGRALTDAEIRQICDQYLLDVILQNYLELAKVNEEAEEKRIASKIHNSRNPGFWNQVIVSFVGNILFLAIVLVTLKIGSDQWQWILSELNILSPKVDP